jgi:hypothetical protein
VKLSLWTDMLKSQEDRGKRIVQGSKIIDNRDTSLRGWVLRLESKWWRHNSTESCCIVLQQKDASMIWQTSIFIYLSHGHFPHQTWWWKSLKQLKHSTDIDVTDRIITFQHKEVLGLHRWQVMLGLGGEVVCRIWWDLLKISYVDAKETEYNIKMTLMGQNLIRIVFSGSYSIGRLTIFFGSNPNTYFWNYLKVLTVYWNIKLYLFSCIFH